MSSRASWLPLLLFSLGFAGCSLRLGDGTARPGTIQLNSQESACLTGGGKVLARFFEGAANDAEIIRLWDCASSSLKLFKERTRGSQPRGYLPQELRTFIESYFVRDFRISDGLLSEAMELKQHLLGGTVDTLTPDEIDRLRELFMLFKVHSLELRPYMPLTPERASHLDAQTLTQAVVAVQRAAEDFGAVLKGTGFHYPFSRLDQLLLEVQNVTNERQYGDLFGMIRSHMPLVQQLKALLVSPDSTQILGTEWDEVLLTSAQAYGIWLRATNLFGANLDMGSREGREALRIIASDARKILERSLARRPDRTIPMYEFDRTIDLAGSDPSEIVLLGQLVPKAHLRALLQVVIQRALGGNHSGPDGREARGLTRAGLGRAWDLFVQWSEGQRYLENAFRLTGNGITGMRQRADLLALPLDKVVSGKTGQVSPETQRAAERIRQALATSRPLFTGESLAVDFASLNRPHNAGGHTEFNWLAASRLNWMDLLSHLLISAYTHQLENEEPNDAVGLSARADRLTYPELERFYLDVRDVGIDLRFIDPLHFDTARKRFGEANLFTFSADGDGYFHDDKPHGTLSLGETRDLLAALFSGKRVSGQIYDELTSSCAVGPKDIYGFLTIEPGCFRETVFSRLTTFWRDFPGLTGYFKSASDADRARFACRFEQVVRREGFSSAYVDSGDLDGFGLLPHYIEMAFARFDRNHDGFLDEHEAFEGGDPVYPVFRPIMREAILKSTGEQPSEERIQTIFSFYLANGRRPTTTEYLLWYARHFNPVVKGVQGDWTFKTDRGKIMDIMAEFSSGGATSAGEAEASDTAKKSGAAAPSEYERKEQECEAYWASHPLKGI